MANPQALTSHYYLLLSLVSRYFMNLNCNTVWKNVVYGRVFLPLRICVSSRQDYFIHSHDKYISAYRFKEFKPALCQPLLSHTILFDPMFLVSAS